VGELVLVVLLEGKVSPDGEGVGETETVSIPAAILLRLSAPRSDVLLSEC